MPVDYVIKIVRQMEMDKIITMAHGSGGRKTSELIDEIFSKYFDNEILAQMEDSSVVPGADRLAMTTDSFVVNPIEFPGGDIGKLAVCGTVNDLLMRGAVPKYLTCGFILEEGLEIDKLERIARSMADTAEEAGVTIVAGDTKVVEGKGGMYINTAGVGFLPQGVEVSVKNIMPGDTIIVSGTLGDHHSCILSQRMEIENDIKSDVAPLNDIVEKIFLKDCGVHAMRDVTRGGLATVLKEMAVAAGKNLVLESGNIPVNPMVRDFAGLLGLEPLYMGNEGKMVLFVDSRKKEEVLALIRGCKYGEKAEIIGHVDAADGENLKNSKMERASGELLIKTEIGGLRYLDVLQGEGLPRIC